MFARDDSETTVYHVFLTGREVDDPSDGTKVFPVVVPPSDRPIFFPVADSPPAPRAAARRVKLSFTDAVGVRWLRNEYGLLAECRPNLCVMADGRRTAWLGQVEGDFPAKYGVNVTVHA